MKTFNRVVVSSYLLHVTKVILTSGIIFAALYSFRDDFFKLNASLYYQGLVTFVTGTMIAIFVSVFNSSDVRMKFLRKSNQSVTLYYIILTDLFIIVLSGLGLGLTTSNKAIISLLALVVATCFSLNLTRMIVRLVRIALKDG